MQILAIDPGFTHSGWVLYDVGTEKPVRFAKEPNVDLRSLIDSAILLDRGSTILAVESIASYGMAVGAETFETCVWVGRILERWRIRGGSEPIRIYRKDVKIHLCGSMRAKDPNVRQAIIDRYGGKEKAIGKKAAPGVLYGVSGDAWSALGVAITAAETRLHERQEAA